MPVYFPRGVDIRIGDVHLRGAKFVALDGPMPIVPSFRNVGAYRCEAHITISRKDFASVLAAIYRPWRRALIRRQARARALARSRVRS